MDLFYAPDIISSLCTLSQEESIHCVKVMRFRRGDTIYLTDGKGYLYKASIVDDAINKCTVEILSQERVVASFPYYLHLAVAPTKNTDRYEWFVEKAIEIGVSEITALICDKSEKINLKYNRIERIAVAAIKQSLHFTKPIFNEKFSFKYLVETAKEEQKIIAYCGTNNDLPLPLLQHRVKKNKDTLILIGPEGDFTPNEVSFAKQYGFIPVSLGKNRLRTETAAIVACNTVHFVNKQV